MRSVVQIALVAALGLCVVAFASSARGVSPPTLTRFVAPTANRALPGEKGTAVFIVNADGSVRDVTIKSPAGTPIEDELVRVVRRWVFRPAMLGGHAVACKISIPFSVESQSGDLIVDLEHFTSE